MHFALSFCVELLRWKFALKPSFGQVFHSRARRERRAVVLVLLQWWSTVVFAATVGVERDRASSSGGVRAFKSRATMLCSHPRTLTRRPWTRAPCAQDIVHVSGRQHQITAVGQVERRARQYSC